MECFPRPLMRWSEDFYRPVFSPFGDFLLRENGAPPWCACTPECCMACSCLLHGRRVLSLEQAFLAITGRCMSTSQGVLGAPDGGPSVRQAACICLTVLPS